MSEQNGLSSCNGEGKGNEILKRYFYEILPMNIVLLE